MPTSPQRPLHAPDTALEPETASSPPPKNIVATFMALVLVLLLAALDQTIVSTALPTIVAEIGGINHLSWIVTSYLLSSTVVVPLYGKLGDLYGRRITLHVAVIMFLIGSALCGIAQNLPELIAFRFVQGLGGGGLIVTAIAVVGDIVAPRDRGRYQGFFGGVFALATVLGPLVGGFIVDRLNWRWIFLINIPFALLALYVIRRTIHAKPVRQPDIIIDYPGAALLTVALTVAVIVTSLSETLLSEAPVSLFALTGLGVAAVALFVYVERRAAQPIIPLSLFFNRTFLIAISVGFIVGMALFGSLTLMPIYLQVVRGLDPTTAGLQMTPMMIGVFVSSVTSGQIISRTGRYKIFPIVGTAIMTLAMMRMATLGVDTPPMLASLYMLFLGVGLGMVMQILIMAVQNAVGYELLGVATSSATMFRSIGGSIGASLFGAVFSYNLGQKVANLGVAGGMAITDPVAIAKLEGPLRAKYMTAIVDAFQPVFEVSCVMAFMAFLITFAIREVPLRTSIAASPVPEPMMPQDATSLVELRRIVERMTARENRWRVYERVAADLGMNLKPDALWLLARIGEYPHDIAAYALQRNLTVPPEQLFALLADLQQAGLVTKTPQQTLALTEKGRSRIDQLIARREQRLEKLLADWQSNEHPEVRAVMQEMANSFASTPPVAPWTPPR